MNKKILDHGYIKFIDCWGSDKNIIESARMSTNKGFQGWKKDLKLLRYLWINKHHTPFEMCGLTIEIKCPIFITRQWHRHRTQSYNELSGRYSSLPNENYLPTLERLLLDSKVKITNKQASKIENSKELTKENAQKFINNLRKLYLLIEEIYDEALADGIPKELARIHLPVARYTKFRASANLRNWLHFLNLRLDSHAQWEIQEYAKALGEIVNQLFPKTYELFNEEQLRKTCEKL